MQTKKQSLNNNSNYGSSQHQRSLSDYAMIKTTALVQKRLRKQLDNKFNKNSRKDEFNQSNMMSRKTSASLLAYNPLTKSSYSMNDTITHKAALKQLALPFKKEVKSNMGSRKKITLSYRERFNSSNDSQFFQTKVENVQNIPCTPRLKPSFSAKEVLPRKSSMEQNFKSSMEARRNKFKLLFRQKTSNHKTVSERKLTRIDTKIQLLKQKKTFLRSLMPREKSKPLINRIKPRGQIIKKQKIMTLTLNLIKYLQLYFNMYQYNNIVGSHLKNIQCYSNKIKSVLMLDSNRAKRICNVEEITNLFWAFKEESTRPEFFGEEDLSLFNTLNGYYLKMQKKYVQTLNKFNYFQSKKRKDEKQAFKKTFQKFQKKMGKHDQINNINKFVEKRVRHDQQRRESDMIGLEKRGVTLNLIERSRELILRDKEFAMKKSLQSLKK